MLSPAGGTVPRMHTFLEARARATSLEMKQPAPRAASWTLICGVIISDLGKIRTAPAGLPGLTPSLPRESCHVVATTCVPYSVYAEVSHARGRLTLAVEYVTISQRHSAAGSASQLRR